MTGKDWLIVVLWLVGAVLVLAAVGYVVLRWVALRIAVRVAATAERHVAKTVHRRIGQARWLGARSIDPATEARYLRDVDRLAWLMDRAVPLPVVGGIGLDALLGLVPGAGDLLSFGISSMVVIRAAQLGLAPDIISRLVAIQCTDLVLGALPLVGDIFDVVYKADVRSAAIIRDALDARRRAPQP